MIIDIFQRWLSTVLHQGWAGSSETSWISRSRRSGEDIERMPPSQKPAQQGNQSGESGCQQWVILQEKTQQFSFLSLTSNLNPLFLSHGAIYLPPPSSPFGPSFYVNHLQIKIRSHDASSPPFQIVCQSFKNICSPSHPLTHCCWAGRCCGDAEARRCSEKWSFLKPNKQLWGSHCETLPVAVAAPADDISKGDTVIYIPTSLWFLFLS